MTGFFNEKHEFLGWLIVIFGCTAVAMGWKVSYQHSLLVLVGSLLVMGIKHLKDLNAGKIGFDENRGDESEQQ